MLLDQCSFTWNPPARASGQDSEVLIIVTDEGNQLSQFVLDCPSFSIIVLYFREALNLGHNPISFPSFFYLTTTFFKIDK